MKVAKPNKAGRIEDMAPTDFTLHSIDLGEARHDTKVGLWRSSNEVIEEQLESLKSSKIKMKAEIEELRKFIRLQRQLSLCHFFTVRSLHLCMGYFF